MHRHVTTVAHGGRTLHLELVSSPLRDAAGKVVAGLKLVRDITEQVEAAEALRKAKEELERQNVELRALDQMKDGLVRDVSHELKTPVAKQAMQLEILQAAARRRLSAARWPRRSRSWRRRCTASSG